MKLRLILITAVLLAIILIGTAIYFQQNSNSSLVLKKHPEEPVGYMSLGLKTKPKILVKELDLEKIPNYKGKVNLPNIGNQYLYSSVRTHRDDAIIVDKDRVLFERKIVNPNLDKFNKVSGFVKKYGEPEAKFQGSNYYGEFEDTYVYASKGIAFLVNPFSGSIDEIQSFSPTTVEEYKRLWGKDIYEEKPSRPHP